MNHCAACGHPLGTGRYCTQCGRSVATTPEPDATATMPAVPAAESTAAQSSGEEWRTDTAERPAASPAPDAPPPIWTSPAPARFPLFADEVDQDDEDDAVPGPPTGAGPVQTLPVDAAPWAEQRDHARRPWGWWGAIAAIVVLVVVLALWLLNPGDGARPTDQPAATGSGSRPAVSGGRTGSVTAQASVVVPATAATGQDVDGNRVTYVGKNMLDGVPETAWRMPGDGTGAEITLTLPRTTHLSSVGLINGYAKQAQRSAGGTLDWYHGNRRIEKVEWVFGDGTRVAQDLEDTTAVQSVDVDVDTRTITLRLISVSKPGTGPASRDFTAISDLSLINRG